MGHLGFFVSVTLLLLALAFGLGWWRERRIRIRVEAAWGESAEHSAASTRLLRLAAGELRHVSLALIGQSQAETGAGSEPHAVGIAQKLVGMSETLLAQSEAPGTVRRLEEETVLLQPVLEFAVAQVAAGLGPGRRAWRIAEAPVGASLLADRRALNHILVNVLSAAAASTRDGDGIEVSFEEEADGFLLQVEDEGAGLPIADSAGYESRGIGYGLILARSLMEAHGGRLDVESLARIGTRVRLQFPVERARNLTQQPAENAPLFHLPQIGRSSPPSLAEESAGGGSWPRACQNQAGLLRE